MGEKLCEYGAGVQYMQTSGWVSVCMNVVCVCVCDCACYSVYCNMLAYVNTLQHVCVCVCVCVCDCACYNVYCNMLAHVSPC